MERHMIFWRRFVMVVGLVLFAACANYGSRAADQSGPAFLPTPASAGSSAPDLVVGPDGTVVMSWLEPLGDDRHVLKYTTLDGDQWQSARDVASGQDWFVNWADLSSVVPITERRWVAHWLVSSNAYDPHAYDIVMTISRDRGQSWGAPFTPHDDGTMTQHGFVSYFPWQDGIGMAWLDARDYTVEIDTDDPAAAEEIYGVGLRAALVSGDGKVVGRQLIDRLVCDCCQTGIAVTADGPVVVYRGRTEDEIRDNQVRRFVDGTWSAPVTLGPDNWKILGCPVNGPAISAYDMHVATAWYTGIDGMPRVRFSRSDDGGRSFHSPVEIPAGDNFGRVSVAALADGDAVVSWIRINEQGDSELCLVRISAAGELSPVHVIAQINSVFTAGVPQLVRDGGRLIMAWADVANDVQTLNTVVLSPSMLRAPPE